MVVMPADHYIPDDAFVKALIQAVECAKSGEYLVTVGIKPTRPETGYGYIHAVEEIKIEGGFSGFRVSRFVEKPNAPTAVGYLADGRYYWNSGIFVWQAQAVLQGIGQHMPSLYEGLMRIDEAIITNHDDKIDGIFRPRASPSTTAWKSRQRAHGQSKLRWDDVGTWVAASRSRPLRKLHARRARVHRYTGLHGIRRQHGGGDHRRVNLIIVASREGSWSATSTGTRTRERLQSSL
jgi:mannose-1-phosphate guanylyltransferase